MFKAILDGIRPLKGGGTTITLTCSDSEDIHDIVNKLRKGVHVYGDQEAPVTDSRVAILSNIRSLAEQVAEAIDRELSPPVIECCDITDAQRQEIYEDGVNGHL